MKIIWMAKFFIIARSEDYIEILISLFVSLFINTLFLTTINIWNFKLIKLIWKNFSLG